MAFRQRARILNLAQQLAGLQVAFPDGVGRITNRMLRWSVALAPTPISRSYNVDLEMTEGQRPQIFVRDPCLAALVPDREIPHLFRQNPAELCLYRALYREWRPELALSKTVIPWSSLWLYYFEEWVLSDEWKGGGEHPPARRSQHKAQRLRHR